MAKRDQDEHPCTQASKRRARMEHLLFAGAMLATTALTLGTVVDPKLPPFVGE